MASWIFLLIQLGFAVLILFLTLAFLTGAPFVPSTTIGGMDIKVQAHVAYLP